jgi:hypothetical protein
VLALVHVSPVKSKYGHSKLYFQGNAPQIALPGDILPNQANQVTTYRLPGTTGWGATFGGLPTALWSLPHPVILANSTLVRDNRFGFTISWATGQPVVVEATTKLGNPDWSPVSTNTLTSGFVNFNDSQGMGLPARFFRVRPL